jgi:homopolymeric O-antigen transport system ATP-binding protein
MTADLAISVSGLSKRYRRGKPGGDGSSFREVIQNGVTTLFRGGSKKGDAKLNGDFWALKNATFDVARGENVGIIGLNGAGKSTLLKILSRITTPTEGSGRVEGRLGALIEVGTGFHQELTGRENVFLYGSILGMTRKEIERKFDAIVEFSEIGDFIDTPVKRYSSGMYVRLAFSVAAHLDPDILLLDEVLAVGDFTFQRKCLDFAHELERKGATILFVSHNMFSIKSMCQRVIYLKKGEVVFDGSVDEGLRRYEADCRLAAAPWFHPEPGIPQIDITSVEIMGENGQERSLFDFGERMRIRACYKASELIERPNFLVSITRSDDLLCNNFCSTTDGIEIASVAGEGVVELLTPPLKLVSDMYTVSIVVRERGFRRILRAQTGGSFHVRHPIFEASAFGVLHESGEWSIEPQVVARAKVSNELR